ncbi:hypothetical protein LZG74_17015 [Dyadobacter sp. CY327]|uniref:hypothetical protein n=1 Tax=Dyadobacter sp. CY327 TaxID=2907301 RepID=UPI001F1E3F95|nr:hypothetical protein [Dyadobacter sp. CY327]MCE7072020.1 hypothetical protein [Dyadobacter sp. CY327]
MLSAPASILTVLLFLTLTFGVSAQQIGKGTNQHDTTYLAVKKEVSELRSAFATQKALDDAHHERIQDIVALNGYFFAGAGLFLAIIGLLLGGYVSKQTDKIMSMASMAEQARANAESAARRSEQVKDWIENDIDKIYNSIKRAEIENILKRLQDRPEDINNLGAQLFAANLTQQDYLMLKVAMLNQVSRDAQLHDHTSTGVFASLMFQHFPYKSSSDRDLEDIILGYIIPIFRNCFKVDLCTSIPEALRAYLALPAESMHQRVVQIWAGLRQTRYSRDADVIRIFCAGLQTKYNALRIYKILKENYLHVDDRAALQLIEEIKSTYGDSHTASDILDIGAEIDLLEEAIQIQDKAAS